MMIRRSPFLQREREVLTDKPAHAHLRRFNMINNYVNIIVIMYFWRKQAVGGITKGTQLLLRAHDY